MNSPNIFAPNGYLSRQAHEARNGHKGACVWLTGLSASGKTSIATAFQSRLHELGIHAYALDGDILRAGLCKDLRFTAEDRVENVRRAGAVAGLMVDAGLVVSCAFISPYRLGRDAVREALPEGRFIECHVQCPLEVCEDRDPKGLYERARAGDIPRFTGVSAPYEEPADPELVLDTSAPGTSPEDCAERIIALLVERQLIEGP